MRKLGTLCLVVGLLVAVTGCSSLSGTWTVKEIVPPSEKGKFEMGKITFHSDGKFTAEVTYGGKVKEVKGTYTYDAKEELVTFKGEDNKERTYHLAKVCQCAMCKCNLQVWNVGAQKDWVATLVPAK